MISLVRVDNRLIHGQVVEAWLPFLKVGRVVVADDEASESPLIRAAMGLAVSSAIDVQIEKLHEIDFQRLQSDGVKTLVLVRDVKDALVGQQRGLPLQHLNLGNVHFATGRKQVSPSVFLSDDELAELSDLVKQGAEVEVRAVPSDRPIAFPELVERHGKGSEK